MIITQLFFLLFTALQCYGRVQLRAECEKTTLPDAYIINFYWTETPQVIKLGTNPDAELRLLPLGTKNHGPLPIPTFLSQGADMILRHSWMSQLEVSIWSLDGQTLHSNILLLDIPQLCSTSK